MRGPKTILLTMVLIAVPLAIASWVVQEKIASDARAEIGRSLTTVRDTTRLALRTWFEDQRAAAVAWADTSDIRAATRRLLAVPPQQATLLSSPAQQALREWFSRIQTPTRYRGFFIVGPSNINLASSRDQNTGVENLLTGQRDFLTGVWVGEPAVSLPIRSDVPLAHTQGRLVSGLPSMFVAAPIRDDAGAVIAIFMFRLDPEQGFTNILRQGRIGNTGETYAFDSDGRLISLSRFDDQLRDIGLVPPGERGILNIQLRDPGVNLSEGETTTLPRGQQPFTHMAKMAMQGTTGVDLHGHRDYRGVPVLSAWVWDTELGLGIATEVDVQEAYGPLRVTQLVIIALSLLAFFLLLGLTAIYTLLHQRKVAEDLARAERDKAQLYLDTVGTAIVALDKQGDISLVNKTGCDLLGYAHEELIGRNWFTTCIPKAQREKVYDVFNAIISGAKEGVAYYENEIVTRSGEHRLLAWHNAYITDAHGNIAGSLSAGQDITERKQTEEALRESEARFRLLVEGIGKDYLIYRLSFDDTYQYLSPAIEHFAGISTEEALGRKWWEVFKVSPETWKRVANYSALQKAGEFVEPYEERYVHPDNSIRTVEITERPEFDEHGNPIAVLGIIKDITERNKVEEELRRAATVFENTDEAIIVTNAEAEILLVNKAFTVISGYEPEDVLGKNPRFQRSGHHDAEFYRAMWDVLKRDGQWRGEIWNRRKNGEVYPAWENINAVKDEQGDTTNYVAIFSDISVLKLSEERLDYLAHHDSLTDLPNRLRFLANLDQAIKIATRHQHSVALMFLDLDRFKHVNDTLGHSVGDQLLKAIAERLKDCVRAEDTVARLGGDEFTVVLTEVAQAEDAGLIADKIIRAIREPVTVGAQTIDTSTSLGISIFPDDASDCDELIKAADTAMYHAKASGGDRFQFFTAELASRVFEHAELEKGVAKSVRKGR